MTTIYPTRPHRAYADEFDDPNRSDESVTQNLWDQRFAELEVFEKRYGHVVIPYGGGLHSENIMLGGWLRTQRHNWAHLNQPCRDRLLNLGFDPNHKYTVQDLRYAELAHYKLIHGDLNVPRKNDITGEHKVLSDWLVKLRVNWHNVDPFLRDKLYALGFDPSPIKTLQAQRCKELQDYKSIFGHCNVPASGGSGTTYKVLGLWLESQRQKWDKLDDDLRNRLLNIGLLIRPPQESPKSPPLWSGSAFDIPLKPIASQLDRASADSTSAQKTDPDELWQQRFSELRAFRKQNGHCNVPIGGGRHGKYKELEIWVFKMQLNWDDLDVNLRKRLIRLGLRETADETRQVAAASRTASAAGADKPYLGGVDAPELKPLRKHMIGPKERLQIREERFAELVQYKARFGDFNVPHNDADDGSYKALGSWVRNLCFKWKKIDLDFRDRLEAIGFDGTIERYTWDSRFAELERYKSLYGDCNVPTSGVKGDFKVLGRWVNYQRKIWLKLDPEHRDRLLALGFDLTTQKSSREMLLAQLKEFKDRYGHCNVPVTGTKDGSYKQLGRWVSKIRADWDELGPVFRYKLFSMGLLRTVEHTLQAQMSVKINSDAIDPAGAIACVQEQLIGAMRAQVARQQFQDGDLDNAIADNPFEYARQQ